MECRSGAWAERVWRAVRRWYLVPGYDPDREPYVTDVVYPPRNLNGELNKFRSLMGEKEYAYFKEFGVSEAVLEEMKIGYNGRYLVYPYIMEDEKTFNKLKGYTDDAPCIT